MCSVRVKVSFTNFYPIGGKNEKERDGEKGGEVGLILEQLTKAPTEEEVRGKVKMLRNRPGLSPPIAAPEDEF